MAFMRIWNETSYHIVNVGIRNINSPFNSKVDHAFFTMNLICKRLRKTLTTNNLSHCTHISKVPELTDDDFRKMIQIWQ